MWIEQTPNGKYKACERYTDPLTGKTKKATTTIEKDTKTQRKAAESVLKAKIEKLISVTSTDSVTVKELCEAYKAGTKGTVRESSYVSMKSTAKRVQTILGDDTLVNQLTAKYVSDQIRKTCKDDSGKINTSISAVKKILTWGYDHDYLQSKEWLDKIHTVKDQQKKEKLADKYLEKSELEKLLSGMKKKKWQLMTRFLALTGLRIGEALALTVNDIDDQYIHITKTLYTSLNKIADVPKTQESERDIYIQPELAETIREIHAFRRAEQFRYGCRTDLLFFRSDGGILPYISYYTALKRDSERIIGRQVTPHALRHTHVSLLAAEGVSLDVISRRLGHSDTGITKDVYYHVTSTQKEHDNAILQSVKIM